MASVLLIRRVVSFRWFFLLFNSNEFLPSRWPSVNALYLLLRSVRKQYFCDAEKWRRGINLAIRMPFARACNRLLIDIVAMRFIQQLIVFRFIYRLSTIRNFRTELQHVGPSNQSIAKWLHAGVVYVVMYIRSVGIQKNVFESIVRGRFTKCSLPSE